MCSLAQIKIPGALLLQFSKQLPAFIVIIDWPITNSSSETIGAQLDFHSLSQPQHLPDGFWMMPCDKKRAVKHSSKLLCAPRPKILTVSAFYGSSVKRFSLAQIKSFKCQLIKKKAAFISFGRGLLTKVSSLFTLASESTYCTHPANHSRFYCRIISADRRATI